MPYYLFTDGRYYAPFEYKIEISNFKEWGDYLKGMTTDRVQILAYPSIVFGFFTLSNDDPVKVFQNARYLRMDDIQGERVTVYDFNTGTVQNFGNYTSDVDDYSTKPVDNFFTYVSYAIYLTSKTEMRLTTFGSFRDFICNIASLYNLLLQVGLRHVDLRNFLTLIPIQMAFMYNESRQNPPEMVFNYLSLLKYMPNTDNPHYYYINFTTFEGGGEKFRYKNVSRISYNYGCGIIQGEPGLVV
jgi:hypothetical protein